MAAFDFPNSPALGEKFPVAPLPGQVQYTWDGEKWTTVGPQITNALPATELPLMDGIAASVGISSKYAREDHIHMSEGSGTFVAKTGDTMTGQLNMEAGIPINLLGSGAIPNIIYGYKDLKVRWVMRPGNDEPESSGDLGSNFDFVSFDDAGVYKSVPLRIERATGTVFANHNLEVAGRATASGGLNILGHFQGAYLRDWTACFSDSKDGPTSVGILNNAVGPAAATVLEFIGGTGNSYTFFGLYDQSGVPVFQFNAGAAVNGYFFLGQGVNIGNPLGGNKGPGRLNVQDYIYLNGNTFANSWGTDSFNVMYDGSGNGAVFLGGTADPTNYYRNTIHRFQGINGVPGAGVTNIYSDGNILIGDGAPDGVLYFNDTTKYLHYDGSNYTLKGGVLFIEALQVVGPVTVGNAGVNGAYYFGNTGSKYLAYDGTNFILSGGAFYVMPPGAPAGVAASGLHVGFAGSASQYGIQLRPAADESVAALFLNAAGGTVGTIYTSATATSFNTSSSVELKEDLKSFDAGHIIDSTNVYDFKWKSTGERAYGVIAQQAVEVYPTAVTHSKLPLTAESREAGAADEFWGVDYSKYVPVLLQELKALRARVATLEGRTDGKPS